MKLIEKEHNKLGGEIVEFELWKSKGRRKNRTREKTKSSIKYEPKKE